MFTGLIETTGRLARLSRRGAGARLAIEASLEPLALGDSVSVSGVCLTVCELRPGGFSADVSAETLARSTLGKLGPGERVNLERASRLGDRLGGHIVTGHVDDVGRVLASERVGEATRMRIGAPGSVLRFLAAKGSVAVDGVSLTVNVLCETGSEASAGFEVMLVPHTLSQTTLAALAVGSAVNLEADVLSRYVVRHLEQGSSCAHAEPGDARADEALLAKLRAGGFV